MNQPLEGIDIQGCDRCGGNHQGLSFLPLLRPAGDYTHWRRCPTTGEPILLRVIQTNEGTHEVTA